MRSVADTVFSHLKSHHTGYFFIALAALIMGPLLLPGYILTLDMTWVPDITLPATISNTYLLYVLLWTLDLVIPSDILQKLVLCLTLWGIGYGTFKLVARLYKDTFKINIPQAAALAAGTLAVINPFTYARFMDGHWQVLIGYAVLPWLAWRLIALIKKPTFLNALWWGVALIILTTAGSVHMIPMGVLLCLAIFVGHASRENITRKLLLLLAGVLFLVALINLMWLIPSVFNGGSTVSKISSFDYRHNATFRTRGFGWVPPELNVLTLHGYWGEAEGRFMVVQQMNPLWLLVFAIIACIAVYGAALFVKRRATRRMALSLIGVAVISWVLSVGTYSWLFGWFISLLNEYVPLFEGYREPQKFAALIALIFSVLFGIGLARLIGTVSGEKKKLGVAAAGILLPIIYTPLILFGTFGQLHTTFYPTEWEQINERFIKESSVMDYKVVFLPWNNYFYFEPAGRTIANLSARYFTGTKIIISEDPGLGLIPTKQKSEEAQAVQAYLIDNENPDKTASVLAGYDVKYILLAKNADWERYQYIQELSGFTLEKDTPTILLYRNELYGRQ